MKVIENIDFGAVAEKTREIKTDIEKDTPESEEQEGER